MTGVEGKPSCLSCAVPIERHPSEQIHAMLHACQGAVLSKPGQLRRRDSQAAGL